MRTPPNRTLLMIAGILAAVGLTALAAVALTSAPPSATAPQELSLIHI